MRLHERIRKEVLYKCLNPTGGHIRASTGSHSPLEFLAPQNRGREKLVSFSLSMFELGCDRLRKLQKARSIPEAIHDFFPRIWERCGIVGHA